MVVLKWVGLKIDGQPSPQGGYVMNAPCSDLTDADLREFARKEKLTTQQAKAALLKFGLWAEADKIEKKPEE